MADQIMRGSLTDCRFSAVFALERVWRDHKAAETRLQIECFFFLLLVLLFMRATWGPRNVGLHSQTHACTLARKNQNAVVVFFFHHLFKGVFFFLKPPFLFFFPLGPLQQMHVEQMGTCDFTWRHNPRKAPSRPSGFGSVVALFI